MVGSDIKIDKDGIWYYCGAHMFRKEILCVFFENLKVDDCGEYFIKLNDEIYYLDVEDTAFVITAVDKMKDPRNGQEHFEVLLSDDGRENLDLSTLAVGRDDVMYCRVKEGKFAARFTRKSYYQLAEFIEQGDADDKFYVFLNNKKHFIKNK
jgi:uncharacterized protein